MTNETVGRRPRALSQTCWLLQISEVVDPKLTILFEPFGAAIARLVFKQGRKGAKSPRFCNPAGYKGRIDISHASRHEREAKPIHHNMVVARIPEEAISRCFEQSVSEQRTACEVNRLSQVGPHPSLGCRLRIGRATDIQERHGPIGSGTTDLARHVRIADEADVQSLCFSHDLSQCHLKQCRVNGAADFQVFGKIICGARLVDRLSEPNAKLSIRQGKRIILLYFRASLLSSRQGGCPRIPALACHSRRRPTLPISS